MSFILDALKKIEQEKRRDGSGAAERLAVARRSHSPSRQAIAMGAIALVSAVVTALALSSFSGQPAGDDEELASAMASPEPSASSAEPARRERLEEAPRASVPAPEPEPAPEAPNAKVDVVEPAAPSPEPPDPPEPRDEERTDEQASRQRDGGDDPPGEEQAAPLDEEDAAVEAESAGPSAIRLVGRERAARGIVEEEPRSERDDAETPPGDLPDLVLQGTSVIGDQAVAVISDQRVFEGDRIKGALVLRIEEREVELEIDGRRFVLRL